MRRPLVVGLAVLGAALLGAALLAGGPADSPLARTGDGRVEVRAAVFGDRIDFLVPRWRALPRLARRRSWMSFPVPRLLVHAVGAERTPVYEASCGCRFEPDMTGGGDGDTVFAAYDFPRRDRTLRLRFAPGEGGVASFPNPFPEPAPATSDGVEDLPVTVRVGDETWILARSESTPDELAARAVDASRSGFEWTFRSAEFSDASGNRVRRAADSRATREHRIALPQDGLPFRLCPHEPWWELELQVDDARTVRWRFRPPR